MVRICHCGRNFSFDRAHKEPAPADWQANEVWVCDKCKGLSHAVAVGVTVVRGPANARQLAHSYSHANGQHTLTWRVGDQRSTERTEVKTVEFYPYPRRVPVSDTEPLIFRTWELLQSKVAVILAEPKGPSDNELEAAAREQARHEARGIAEVLAILMKPFMKNPDHVVREAVKFYRDNSHQVPGLGLHLWDPTKNPDGSERVPLPTKKISLDKPKARPKVNNKSTKTLTAEETEGIREAVSSGMFKEEEVASMFGVSMDTLQAALKG